MAVAGAALASDSQSPIRRNLRLVGLILAGLVVGLGGLAAVIPINGAVIAAGQVTVSSEVKKVQHPTGGVVAEIRVKDGDRVRQGDVLLALDPTVANANYSITRSGVDELTTEQARLEAERDSRPMRFPPELLARKADPAVAALMAEELRLFRLHADDRSGQKAQLRERENQLRQEIAGFQEESDAKQKQIVLIGPELAGVRQLYAKQLIPLTRLNSLERDAAQLRGDVGQLAASVAEARGKIAEIELGIIGVDQDSRSKAGGELSDVQNKLTELQQRNVTAEQEYRRVLIRAPQDGVVDRLAFHTVGGVIAPGEAILYLVPDKDRLSVETRVRPTDVDQVKPGQIAMVRFSAFDVRTTPELRGVVNRVSAETHADEHTGATYYTATVDLPPAQLERLHGLKLVAGMPVESFIQTRPRTMLAYIAKPLGDQLHRSFREN
jgi:HlyD family secretion protein